jgi:hypothetical protein
MIALKGKSYRLRERGLDVIPAAQAPSLRDSAKELVSERLFAR